MTETKWDILYDTEKRTLFSKIEEFAINTETDNQLNYAVKLLSG